METSLADIIKTLKEEHISLFSLADFHRLFNISNRHTFYKKIQNLQKRGVAEKLVKGKYLFSFGQATDFEIANYLYAPSYVSLESALSFYGIITGFPYLITSITTKKPRTIRCRGKDFVYSRIVPRFYFGFEKKNGFLMAEPEKALLDYLYFGQKGLRSREFDEMDFSILDKKKLTMYAKMMAIKKVPL